MRFYYDTEFIEDGKTTDLISIGVISDDGREYYAANRDMPAKRIAKHDWLMRNVVPSLPRLHGDARMQAGRRNPLALDWHHPDLKRREQIANEVRDFILGDDNSGQLPHVELWADYGAYDHVALCQLFGTMMDLPEGMPMFTHDIQHEASRLGLSDKDLPKQESGVHNALADARHAKDKVEFLASRATRERIDVPR